jgi:hypothetical protein
VPLSEGVSATIRYKAYSTGVITANSQPLIATDPGASGGQLLRRVSSTIDLAKNTYQSAEIRSDRQIADFRHGTRHVQGKIAGELSPASYFDFFEAVHRDTKVSAISLSQVDFTSLAASASGSSITLGSGDAAALGLRVGDIIRLGGTTANDAINFTILSMATSNTVLTVTPAPADQVADTTCTLSRPGASTQVPSTGHVSRKYGIEVYGSDIDVTRMFKECRIAGYTLGLPATGMSTVDFDVAGRDMEVLTAGSAPFFASPTAATSSGVCASVNGVLLIGGTVQGVVTGVNMTMNLSPTFADVVGQNYAAEIFLGRNDLTGNMTAYFQDSTLIGDFLNESQVALLLRLDASSAANTDSISIYLPRIKLGGASVALTGEGGQIITMPFQALLGTATTATAGVPSTTIRIHDTAAS